jgi:hypothetical protein
MRAPPRRRRSGARLTPCGPAHIPEPPHGIPRGAFAASPRSSRRVCRSEPGLGDGLTSSRCVALRSQLLTLSGGEFNDRCRLSSAGRSPSTTIVALGWAVSSVSGQAWSPESPPGQLDPPCRTTPERTSHKTMRAGRIWALRGLARQPLTTCLEVVVRCAHQVVVRLRSLVTLALASLVVAVGALVGPVRDNRPRRL